MDIKFKRSITIVFLFIITLLFTACSDNKLAEVFDEAVVKESARTAITLLSDGDYKGVSALVSDSVKDKLTAEVLQDGVKKVMPSTGKLLEYKGETAVGQKDEQGTDFAVVQSIVRYENQTVIFTISFDTNMKLVGFFMK